MGGEEAIIEIWKNFNWWAKIVELSAVNINVIMVEQPK